MTLERVGTPSYSNFRPGVARVGSPPSDCYNVNPFITGHVRL